MGRADVQVEVEAKFDLRGGRAAPDLRALAGVKGVHALRDGGRHRLTATYYDTPDLTLLRHGVTLRRRTGGTDAGWHVKFPVPTGRLEVRRPAGKAGSAMPAELRALVRALLLDRTPTPVVRLTTTRRLTHLLDEAGAVLAEIAQDDVRAQVLGDGAPARGWSEVEVELVDGPPSLLAAVAKRLRRDGATSAAFTSKLARALDGQLPAGPVPNGHRAPRRRGTAGAVVLAHLRGQRDELVSQDPQVRLDTYDAVHRMRVATRRLRSTLTSFGPLFDAAPARALRAELAWLAGVLGAARDAEVLRDLLVADLAALPEPALRGPVADRIAADLAATYRQAHAQAVVELDGDRYLALLTALDGFLAAPPLTRAGSGPARDVVPTMVNRAVRRVTRELKAARAEPDLPLRELRSHEVRKAAKRARYAAEAVQPVFGPPARAVAKVMRRTQETLGSHQDSLLAREWLVAAAARADRDGEPTFTYGVLYARQSDGHGDTDANLAAVAQALSGLAPWPADTARR